MLRYKEWDHIGNLRVIDDIDENTELMEYVRIMRARRVKQTLHNWQVGEAEAIAIQNKLAPLVIRDDTLTRVSRVAGVDVAYDETSVSFFSQWHTGITNASKKSKKSIDPISLDPRNLIPKADKWFRYEGSLTTAPYNELVSWLVFTNPLSINSADLKKLNKHTRDDDRGVQPVSRRYVLRNFA